MLVYFSHGTVARLSTIKSDLGIAIQVASEAKQKGHISVIRKDISWLWRTAYNCANQGCAEWDDAEKKVPVLFDLAGQVR